ncbi:the Ing1 Phd finger in complex with A histone H3k4me3 peptide [Mycena latifolia]|nr:the Ing1 Phd finger in complex with A histone H3k4me3 peptide [Mycena latifolia]
MNGSDGSQDHEIFCFCQRESYGVMIGCDAEEKCPYQWFHLECIGLQVSPDGPWFCGTCRSEYQ